MHTERRTPLSRTALLTTALLTAACTSGTEPDRRIVAGVDLDALFAPPTPAEIAAVEADWDTRATPPVDVEIVLDSTFFADTTLVRLLVVQHDVGGVTHVGAILAAERHVQPVPTVVYTHGGDDGVSVDEVLAVLPFLGDGATDFVWVIPSFRSERLRFGASSWVSEGPPSPWDRDVDDALSLLETAFQLVPSADPTRVGVLGFSRGAGVGLLMGARDPRIDRVVEFFGPTDFFGPYAQDVVEAALLGQAPGLPGVAHLDATFLQPLVAGTLTIDEVRLELIRRSAVHFADRLPVVQIHHGTADAVVDVSQAEALVAALQSVGGAEFEAFIYPNGTHNPLSLFGSVQRVVIFLEGLR